MRVPGRNEQCTCGSGEKYKKCCMNKDPFDSWQNNSDIILGDIDKKENIKSIFFEMLKFIRKENWQGACHASSSVMYVLFKEIGLNPTLYVGEVRSENLSNPFDHSWIEIDDKIVDAAIFLGLNNFQAHAPILLNYNIDTVKLTASEYGIHYLGLDNVAQPLLSMPVVKYMDGFPSRPNGLWDIVAEVASSAGIKLDMQTIREKYVKAVWNPK
ncbi:hypothetical protein SDC9_111976 [bioreactor metagenome]|uniref:Uncharacterized protein n=1 Tax=bioreactor metagenome TaxID=1076179 RepID=A0A645BTF3_9ZZZZ